MDGRADTLRIEVSDSGESVHVTAVGEVDIATAEQLATVADVLRPAETPVLLDLSRVTFMDSSGVRALLDLARTLGDSGRRLALVQPSSAVTRLLDLVELRDRFVEMSGLDAPGPAALPPS